jgi:hypothetical protein
LTYFLEYFRSFYGFDGEATTILGLGFGLAVFYLILEAFLFKAVLYPRQQKATAFGRG